MNNNNYLEIEPKEIVKVANKIKIKVLALELNISAIIKVEAYSFDGNILNTYQIILQGQDYKNWTNDDYLIQYVCTEFGFTLV
jgi:hypothetical protein